MRRFTTLMTAMVLVLAACGTSATTLASPAAPPPSAAPVTAAPATPPPTATAAPTPDVLAVSVTFDGRTCTYAGPPVLPVGTALAFTLTNTPATLDAATPPAGLVVVPVVDGTTWEQIQADLVKYKASEVPDWARIPGAGADGLDEANGLSPEGAAAGNVLVTRLTRDAYYVGCHTSAKTTDTPHGAILLRTMAP